MVSLGKGFFNIHFASVGEMQKFQSKSSWLIPSGVFRTMPWQVDFNSKGPKTTYSGIPLQLNETAKLRNYGQFARILIALTSLLLFLIRYGDIKSISFHVEASTPDNRDVQSLTLEIKEGDEFDRMYRANKGYSVGILSREDISERKFKDQEEVGNKSGGDDNFKLDTSKSEKRPVVTKTAAKNKSLPKRSRGCSKLFE
ncbi:hypothetical protein LguiB_021474 [Lonicera macranthoides]